MNAVPKKSVTNAPTPGRFFSTMEGVVLESELVLPVAIVTSFLCFMLDGSII